MKHKEIVQNKITLIYYPVINNLIEAIHIDTTQPLTVNIDEYKRVSETKTFIHFELK